MNQDYSVANVKDSTELVKMLSGYEADLSGKTGQDIVLVAYSKEKKG